MPDLTRDEWDDMQVGYDADGGEAWYVNCARCDKQLDIHADEAYLEEGDEWECNLCNIRCDAHEYYDRGEYVHVDIYINENGSLVLADSDTACLVDRAIVKYLLKG